MITRTPVHSQQRATGVAARTAGKVHDRAEDLLRQTDSHAAFGKAGIIRVWRIRPVLSDIGRKGANNNTVNSHAWSVGCGKSLGQAVEPQLGREQARHR